MGTHTQAVHHQFDSRAEAYLTSSVHAAGPDLTVAAQLVAQRMPAGAQVLDVGTGAGHLSFALAPVVSRIVALDPSAGMLQTVRRAAAARGLAQIETCTASASALPFADATFDLVCTRYSAHHWTDVARALAEMRRVVKPSGCIMVIDILGADQALVDTHLQAIELLRDPSHVRNRSVAEWRTLLREGGFERIEQRSWLTRLEFAPWIARMDTPAVPAAAIRKLQTDAPTEVQQALRIEADGSFTPHTGLFWGHAVLPVA